MSSGSDLDKILGIGKYQYRVIFLLGLPILLHGMQVMSAVFLFAVPDHRCEMTGWTGGDTYRIQGDNHSYDVELTIPRVKPDADNTVRYSACSYYKRTNETTADDTSAMNASSRVKNVSSHLVEMKCGSWVYDKGTFQSTAVSEMNLVCDKTIKAAHLKMSHILGWAFGSSLGGALSDRFGRKKYFFMTVLLSSVGGVGQAYAPNYIALMILRITTGIADGGIFVVFFVLCMELVSLKYKAVLGIALELFWAAGVTLFAGIAYGIRDWRYLQMVISFPYIPCLLLLFFVPESPRWLITQGRMAEAKAIIDKITLTNQGKTVELDMEEFRQTKTKKTGKLWHLLTDRTMFFRASIVFFNWMVASMLFYGLVLNLEILGGDLYLDYLISCVVEIGSYLLSLWAIQKCDRKVFHCTTMLTGGVACTATILPILLSENEMRWLTMTLAMIGRFGVAAAFACIYMYTAELFPTTIRNSTVGFSSLMGRIGSITAPYVAQIARLVPGRKGKSIPMIVFGVAGVLAGLLALFLPETRHSPLPDTVEEAKKISSKKSEETSDESCELQQLTETS